MEFVTDATSTSIEFILLVGIWIYPWTTLSRGFFSSRSSSLLDYQLSLYMSYPYNSSVAFCSYIQNGTAKLPFLYLSYIIRRQAQISRRHPLSELVIWMDDWGSDNWVHDWGSDKLSGWLRSGKFKELSFEWMTEWVEWVYKWVENHVGR